MIHLLAVSLCLSQAPEGGITSDELDAYAARAVQARTECGPIAAWYCLGKLGHPSARDEVLRRCPANGKGVTIEALLELFSSYGVSAWARTGEPANLSWLPVPAILVMDSQHCVVFNSFDEGTDTVDVFDPALGKNVRLPTGVFASHWSGEVILFATPDLSPRAFAGLTVLSAIAVVVVGGATARMAWRRESRLESPVHGHG